VRDIAERTLQRVGELSGASDRERVEVFRGWTEARACPVFTDIHAPAEESRRPEPTESSLHHPPGLVSKDEGVEMTDRQVAVDEERVEHVEVARLDHDLDELVGHLAG